MKEAEKVILLMNLGSPDSTEVKDVRRYLNEFLMDKRVLDMAAWKRTLLVKGIITPLRAPKSAKAYRSVWTEEGSPLIVLTQKLQAAVAATTGLPVEICMRYGTPSPKVTLDQIKAKYPQAKEVVLVPLYPHYAWSSYETAALYVIDTYKKGNYGFDLHMVPPFFNEPNYIKALADSMRPYLQEPFDLLLFSYHGIPERHITKRHLKGSHNLNNTKGCCTDAALHQFCYRHQIIAATELVAKELELQPNQYRFTFQSRLGRDPWLQPYTAATLEKLPAQGVKKVVVVCPAFVSDCLETIEEMGMEGKHSFLEAGGTSFTLIPCLNLDENWVRVLSNYVTGGLINKEPASVLEDLS